MRRAVVVLFLAGAGCIDFRSSLEEFCIRNPGRCAADAGAGGGSGGGVATGGGSGGAGGTGGGMMTGGGMGGGMDAGSDGGVDAGCTRPACLVATTRVPHRLFTLWGSGPNDVWFAGSQLYRWNGTSVAFQSDNPSPMYGLFASTGSAPDDVWVGGFTYPEVYRYDGQQWRTRVFDGGQTINAMYAKGRDDVFMVTGETLWHWDGGSWQGVYVNANNETFNDMSGTPGAPVWIVAGQRAYAVESDFSVTQESISSVGSDDLFAVSVTPTGNVWAVGSDRTVVRRGWDAGWERLTVDVGVSGSSLFGVWARSDDEVWMCGTNGTILQWRSDAGFVSRGSEALPAGANLTQLAWQDIWGQGKNLWLAGTTGVFNPQYDGGITSHFILP